MNVISKRQGVSKKFSVTVSKSHPPFGSEKTPHENFNRGSNPKGVSECDTASANTRGKGGFVVAWQEQDNPLIWWF